MIGEWIRFGVTALSWWGGFSPAYGAAGPVPALTMPWNRLHAAAIADTLALGLVLLGRLVAVGFRAVLWKLVLVLVIRVVYLSPVQPYAGAIRVPGRAGGSGPLSGAAGETEEVSAP